MVAEHGSSRIERSFQDIPDDKITEADRSAFLMELGWQQGSSWDDLLKSKRVLLISEAGAGKTYECHAMQQALWAAGEPAFYVELAELSRNSLRELLLPEEISRLDAWHTAQSDVATFFLDSIDELKLSLGSFKQALTRLATAVAGQLGRVRIVVTSRPVPIDEQLFRRILPVPDVPEEAATSEDFADVAMSRQTKNSSVNRVVKDWRNVALLPLSSNQIKYMAIEYGVSDPDALLADILRRNAEEFVRRPQDLIELCADWRDHHRIRSHSEQVASNITVKLKPRADRQEITALSADKSLEGARRLALAAMLSRKLTLRHSTEADRPGDLVELPLDPSSILHDWTPDERKTLLERSLFGYVSYGRVRFHHRSVVEYLAAEHLHFLLKRGMPKKAIKRILFTTTAQGAAVVKPTMRPIAAWMAVHLDFIFEELLLREPDVVLNQGDPESLLPVQRLKALRAYVERHGSGGWRGLRVPTIQLHRLANSDLGPEVRRLWGAGIENQEIREILLSLIGLGKMTECADIAHGVAISAKASYSERIGALEALDRLDDPRLAEIVASLACDSELWPSRITRAALMRLFPTRISVGLLCKSLGRLKERDRSVDDIAWHLPQIVENADLPADELEALRKGLTDLVEDEVVWDEKRWPHLASKRKFVLPVLAACCLRQISSGAITHEVMRSAAVAVRLTENAYSNTEPTKQLEASLTVLPPNARRFAFEAEDAFLQAYKAEPNANRRFSRVAFQGLLNLVVTDAEWILESLADFSQAPEKRAMMLEAAICIRDNGVTFAEHLQALRPYVADLPRLLDRLDELAKPHEPDPDEERWRKESAKRQELEDRRQAKAHSSWVRFWNEIANNLEAVFAPDRSENTAWNLWCAMERSGEESRASGWNRRFIERHFGKDVADRVRFAIMAFWRKERPTLRSERADGEKNSYLKSWQFGLAGIAAEAEDIQWAEKLSDEEATLALRYVPLELNGFPAWLEGVATANTAAVDAVLGSELTAELAEPAENHSSMLQNIRHGVPAVSRLFVPRLRTWLDEGKWRFGNNEDEVGRANRVSQVIEILMEHGDAETTSHLHALAKTETTAGVESELTRVLLPVLMRIRPADGIEAFEKMLRPLPPAKFGPAVEWFSALFGDRHDEGKLNLTASGFTPELLLRLARLAYLHISPTDDMVREGGGYTPNVRDHAERGRGRIISALLSTSGQEGWVAKLELAEDRLFVDFKDRALAIARERAAEEADAAAFAETDIVALNQFGELPPLTRDEMFALMIDRLDDVDDALLRDDSPRAAWELVEDEKVMRQLIARELRVNANGAYNVDQEAVTADEKETDIRLRSTASDHEAIIELKIGEKPRSAADLKSTLKDQLVIKYMAAENCRAGCLLITTRTQRKWQHPETGATLDLAGLTAMLNEEADRIVKEMGNSLCLTVRGLNLQPRLPTERATSRRSRRQPLPKKQKKRT